MRRDLRGAAPPMGALLLALAGCSVPVDSTESTDEGQEGAAAQAVLAMSGGYVRLQARHSGHCVVVSGGSQSDGASLVQWSCNGNPDQGFLFESFPGLPAGTYRIKAKHSGKCLLLAPNGQDVVQGNCASAHPFLIGENGDGSYAIHSQTDPSKVLEVFNASSSLGAAVVIYANGGGANQRFVPLSYRDPAALQLCYDAPPVTADAPNMDSVWCDGYNMGTPGCWADLSDGVEWCRRYGVNFGKSWGPGYNKNQYYDAIDRCAYWHDHNTWDVPGDPILLHAQAWQCMSMVQPASPQEERARFHGMYWLPHDPATLARSGHYVDPRLLQLAKPDPERKKPRPFVPGTASSPGPGDVPQPDSFMRVSWASQQGGYWDTQQWAAGDFNGDGATDLAKVFNDGNLASADVHLTGLRGFTLARWESQTGSFSDGQKWMAGDFNGDGKSDLVNVFDDGGLNSIDVHVSSGSSFTRVPWETQGGGFWATQKWMTGDFNGDGKTDVANVFNDGGLASIDVHVSNGSSFTRQRWETQAGGFWDSQQWVVGDFDGDGKDDIALVFNDAGLFSVDVHVSSGTSLTGVRWSTQRGAFNDSYRWLSMRRTIEDPPDPAGTVLPHRSDLVYVYLDNGYDSIAVRRANGAGFDDAVLWLTRYGVLLPEPPVSPAVWATRKWLSGAFNTVGSIARVYGVSGAFSADMYLR